MENWKKIPLFNMYSCSNLGRIRNDTTNYISKCKPRKNTGYIESTRKNDQNRKICVSHHRLVALTWLPNPENKPTVNHKNKIRHDNRVENLEWATYSEQVIHQNKSKSNRTSSSGIGVWQCNKNTGEKIKYFKTMSSAGLFIAGTKKASSGISGCSRGKLKSSYGYKWIRDTKNIYDIEKSKKMNEKWELFETNDIHKYYISNYGRIRNNTKLLTPYKHRSGYYHSFINKKTMRIHRLVAKYFVLNPNNYKMVNHIDGNKLNNHHTNLEWCTNRQNTIHAMNNGLISTIKKVVRFTEDGDIIKIYNTTTDAGKDIGVCASAINKCCKGIHLSCGEDRNRYKYIDDNDDIDNMKISDKYLLWVKSKPLKRAIKIACYDKDNNLLKIYKSAQEVADELHVDNSSIYKCCKGKIKTIKKKYKFKFS